GRAVRLLHPGPADGRPGPARGDPAARGRRDRGGARRHALPLRLLRADLLGGARDRRDGDGRMTPSRIGDSPGRVGGIGRVTGAQQYVADLRPEGVLHAKLVTVDAARARILDIDAGDALRLAGVRLVRAAGALPQPVPRFGPQNRDRPVLAVGETTYHGDPVAVVGADTVDQAEAAAAAVRVAHEPLPAVFTVAAALALDAPLVQDPALRPGDPLAATNVLNEHLVGWGDVDA